ncbi:MAG: hypothetical protein MJ212_06360, partial [Alphaproteobacteria bacterium]|nr:hypothetical protein [Alphaproteobacteria bacterium]
TINNCLNASTNLAFESSTCGGIIGEADDCLVTNCFSYADRPLIGNVTWLGGMRQGTGNNYRYKKRINANSNTFKKLYCFFPKIFKTFHKFFEIFDNTIPNVIVIKNVVIPEILTDKYCKLTNNTL